MKKGSSHWLVPLLPFLGMVVLICIGLVRALFFSRNPVDPYNILIGFATMACFILAARFIHDSDS